MNKIITLFISFLFTSLITIGQVVSLDVGMASNFTPQVAFAPMFNAQYYLKNNDYVGVGTLYDFSRSRETYIVRYGTNLNKRWFLNSGIGFVNDWSNPYTKYHKTYRTYVIGVDYVFPKLLNYYPYNFFTGIDFTDEIMYFKVGMKFFHEKK